jgi:hypothetical protein
VYPAAWFFALCLSVLSQQQGIVLRRLFVLVFAAAGASFLREFSSAAGSLLSLVSSVPQQAPA